MKPIITKDYISTWRILNTYRVIDENVNSFLYDEVASLYGKINKWLVDYHDFMLNNKITKNKVWLRREYTYPRVIAIDPKFNFFAIIGYHAEYGCYPTIQYNDNMYNILLDIPTNFLYMEINELERVLTENRVV